MSTVPLFSALHFTLVLGGFPLNLSDLSVDLLLLARCGALSLPFQFVYFSLGLS